MLLGPITQAYSVEPAGGSQWPCFEPEGLGGSTLWPAELDVSAREVAPVVGSAAREALEVPLAVTLARQ
jgi:hypothetical protein